MKSTQNNLQTPQVGRPLTRSWVEAVTKNMNVETPYAISIDGDATQLQASPYGWIRILWHENPPREQSGCDALSLFSWVNMGEDAIFGVRRFFAAFSASSFYTGSQMNFSFHKSA